MYKNILYIISFILILSTASASAQQLEGTWKISRVELEKRDFWNNNVLAQWSVTGDSINHLSVPILSSLSFADSTCITTYGPTFNTWTYSHTPNQITLVARFKSSDKDASPMQLSYDYNFDEKNYLLLGPLVVSYTDKSNGQPVKIAYRCRYVLSK
ncbi:MAG: hypothetical protein JO154_26490 [Chitinophaga sp.]|uniref:hypothetical protein n=1 Tax=Chitinophaga sp. TaxID=1869181 RepID=UPI0025B9C557|nr:hypothetical protein [Chitinophaga sp.]MBV8256171.1 hypothetical protein [Chitinophaga sp.]